MALASSREGRFRELAALLPETVFEMDIHGRFRFFNPAGFARFGYTPADLEAGVDAFDLIVPDDRQRARADLDRAIGGRRLDPTTYTCLRKNGATFPGRFYTAVSYHGDRPVGIFGIIVDNSRQMEREDSLRQWKARYQTAARAGLTGVWDHDLRTGEMVIDTNLKHLLGFEQDERVRWDSWQRLFQPDDVTRFMEASRAYIRGVHPRFEVQGRVMDHRGRERWILVRGLAERDASGRVRRMIGSATDVTRFRQVENDLEKAKDDLEAHVQARTSELNEANQALRAVVREKVQTARRLKQREAELELKTATLEDLNTTLRVLLKKMKREKSAVEEKILTDLRDLVHTYLRRLSARSQQPEIRALASILENHLKAIVSPFSRRLTSPDINLTPAELNVAHLVRAGKSSRQIAERLNIAYKTVETHRVNIRKKLGLHRRGGNLRTCLMAMDDPATGGWGGGRNWP